MFDVSTLFLFENLTETEKSEVTASLPKPVSFNKNDCISCGENAAALGIIISGKASAAVGSFTKRSFTAGDTIGAAALFTGSEPYKSQIRAKSSCEVLFLSEGFLRYLFSKYPKTALNYISFLSNKLVFLNNRIDQLSAGGASEKLYRYLAASANSAGFLTVPNMTALAQLTGIGRTSLYRCLDELEASGMIDRKNNTIKVKTK